MQAPPGVAFGLARDTAEFQAMSVAGEAGRAADEMTGGFDRNPVQRRSGAPRE
jgi:hypothetical protein